MVVNRIGDIGVAIGMFMMIITFGSLDFSTIFPLVPVMGTEIQYTIIGICIIIGAVGKSAQIGLHT
jgi:NADH:ubiquinone oxidoreductase subunit 5 (subunit L)/multisubunit Na+/H+ antiporter MnhA subunit